MTRPRESRPTAQAQATAVCPTCSGRVFEQTPFRTDTEVMCRCFFCLTLFRVKTAALEGFPPPPKVLQ